ncbi:hypothetical protein PR048_026046 [Dryococelus australis]|uniref:Uncharacterized protein n=1 Tax=Dryococelus australis TaxID=614101 RepID=A0ABQ9GKA4_9NEOP|nr:hypothetical protein PR048_026046 [Dryococelus australis]
MTYSCPVAPSWFETRSEIGSKIDTEYCCTIRLDESEIKNHAISLVQHFYIGTKIKLDSGSELGSLDLGSEKMLVQPGLSHTIRKVLISRAAPYSPHFALVGSQDIAARISSPTDKAEQFCNTRAVKFVDLERFLSIPIQDCKNVVSAQYVRSIMRSATVGRSRLLHACLKPALLPGYFPASCKQSLTEPKKITPEDRAPHSRALKGDLLARVMVAAQQIDGTPDVVERVYRNMVRRYDVCNSAVCYTSFAEDRNRLLRLTVDKSRISGHGFLFTRSPTQSPLQTLEVCKGNFRASCIKSVVVRAHPRKATLWRPYRPHPRGGRMKVFPTSGTASKTSRTSDRRRTKLTAPREVDTFKVMHTVPGAAVLPPLPLARGSSISKVTQLCLRDTGVPPRHRLPHFSLRPELSPACSTDLLPTANPLHEPGIWINIDAARADEGVAKASREQCGNVKGRRKNRISARKPGDQWHSPTRFSHAKIRV